MFTVNALATLPPINARPSANYLDGNKTKNKLYIWLQAADAMIRANAGLGTGSIFYVDSNVTTEGSGSSWTNAKDTLDEAVNLCTASAGDYIYVAEGHTETLTGADAVDADVIGITIIGYGNGSLAPTFTVAAAADEFAIGADNVRLCNLRFSSSSSTVITAIDVQDGVDYATISDCVFLSTTTTGAPINYINLVNNNTGCAIEGNTFDSQVSTTTESAIMMDADTNQTVIRGNLIQGDYTVACIEGDTTLSTEILIDGNILINGSSDSLIAQPAIDLLTGTTGYIMNNYISCNVTTVAAAMETCDAVMEFNNWYNEDVGATKAATKWSAGGATTLLTSVSTSGDD